MGVIIIKLAVMAGLFGPIGLVGLALLLASLVFLIVRIANFNSVIPAAIAILISLGLIITGLAVNPFSGLLDSIEDSSKVGTPSKNDDTELGPDKEDHSNALDTDSGSTPEVKGQEVSVGEACIIPDLCEFTVNSVSLKKEVLPPNPSSFYTYYSEEDGMTYIDVAVSIKNLRTTARRADDFGRVEATCGSGYEYKGFSAIEEAGGSDFNYTNITDVAPLETAMIHYIIKIPNEIADDGSLPIVLDIVMLDNDYSLVVR